MRPWLPCTRLGPLLPRAPHRQRTGVLLSRASGVRVLPASCPGLYGLSSRNFLRLAASKQSEALPLPQAGVVAWAIFPDKPLPDLIPELCAKGCRHEIVANQLFRFMGNNTSGDTFKRPKVPSPEEFTRSMYATLQVLFDPPTGPTEADVPNKELVFTSFNLTTLRDVGVKFRDKPQRTFLKAIAMATAMLPEQLLLLLTVQQACLCLTKRDNKQAAAAVAVAVVLLRYVSRPRRCPVEVDPRVLLSATGVMAFVPTVGMLQAEASVCSGLAAADADVCFEALLGDQGPPDWKEPSAVSADERFQMALKLAAWLAPRYAAAPYPTLPPIHSADRHLRLAQYPRLSASQTAADVDTPVHSQTATAFTAATHSLRNDLLAEGWPATIINEPKDKTHRMSYRQRAHRPNPPSAAEIHTDKTSAFTLAEPAWNAVSSAPLHPRLIRGRCASNASTCSSGLVLSRAVVPGARWRLLDILQFAIEARKMSMVNEFARNVGQFSPGIWVEVLQFMNRRNEETGLLENDWAFLAGRTLIADRALITLACPHEPRMVQTGAANVAALQEGITASRHRISGVSLTCRARGRSRACSMRNRYRNSSALGPMLFVDCLDGLDKLDREIENLENLNHAHLGTQLSSRRRCRSHMRHLRAFRPAAKGFYCARSSAVTYEEWRRAPFRLSRQRVAGSFDSHPQSTSGTECRRTMRRRCGVAKVPRSRTVSRLTGDSAFDSKDELQPGNVRAYSCLRGPMPKSTVGIDCEWSGDSIVDLLQIATHSCVFLLDTTVDSPKFQHALFHIVKRLMTSERILKLFFAGGHDWNRLIQLFKPYGSPGPLNRAIDLK
eukprot:GHVT01047754.1.p1 GENE.GHVT01047754.1~~GHVT01047754.1.p1  ORF type:complete len:835 (+),score=86.35 GHVT01047754.1:55-2559(+)